MFRTDLDKPFDYAVTQSNGGAAESQSAHGCRPDENLGRGSGWWERRLMQLRIGVPNMQDNLTSEPASSADAHSRKGAKKSQPKRNMARAPSEKPGSPPQVVDAPPQRTSKIDQVLDLLRRPQGATLDEMIEATGWQPHSARAVLTGLRKKGHVIERGKRGEVTCYSSAANL